MWTSIRNFIYKFSYHDFVPTKNCICLFILILFYKVNFTLISGKNLVSKSSCESKAITRGGDRETSTVCKAVASSVVRPIWRRWGSAFVRCDGCSDEAATQLFRRPTYTPARHKYEHTEFVTTTLTAWARGDAWRRATIFLTWRPGLTV